MKDLAKVLVTACCLGFSVPANAVTINSTSSGAYRADGTAANAVILAGDSSGYLRNWFTFDLSSLAGQTITSATLVISPVIGSTKYQTVGGNFDLTFSLFDYTGSISALPGGTAGASGYADLGSGAGYGQATVVVPTAGPGFIGTPVSVTLNASGITDLNSYVTSSIFSFALGGACTDCATGEYLFGNAYPDTLAYLDVTVAETSPVPLPAAFPLFASALIGGGVVAWRKRRKFSQSDIRN